MELLLSVPLFSFERIILPQLALLRFAVADAKEQNAMMGYRVISVSSLQPGYRFITFEVWTWDLSVATYQTSASTTPPASIFPFP